MTKEEIEQEIEGLKVALEDLSSANDTLITYNKDKHDAIYNIAMDYISNARREIKTRIVELTSIEIEGL